MSVEGKRVKRRVEELDLLKALGIICMVLGHAGAPGSHFIYLFHMAVFFMASGFFYKESSSDSLESVFKGIRSRIRQLWLPFVIWNAVFVLLHNSFIHMNIYTDNPQLLDYVSGQFVHTISYYSLPKVIRKIGRCFFFLRSSEQMFGANWFIQILFMVTTSYLIIDYVLKKISQKNILITQLAVSMILLCAGYYCYLHNIEARGLAQTASFYCLYYLGHLLGIYRNRYDSLSRQKYGLMAVISFVFLYILGKFGSVSLNINSYKNPLFLILTSLSGWFMLYGMSALIKNFTLLKNILIVIGRHTLSIVALHFLAFKTVEIIVVRVYGLPDFCLAAFPNLYGNVGIWWIAYTIAGVAIPVILNLIYEKCMDFCKQKLLKG